MWPLGYGVVLLGSLMIFAIAGRRIYQPYLALSLALIVLIIVIWIERPRFALYAVMLLAPIGDGVTAAWFPFTKNLSSQESISFVADSVTVSPLELCLGTGFVVVALRNYASQRRFMPPNPLNRVISIFAAFVAIGLFRGVMTGGSLRIAIWEVRGIAAILLTFAIATTTLTERRHLRTALWYLLAGVAIHAVLALVYMEQLSPAERGQLESLGDHSAAIPMGLLLLILISALLLRGVPKYTAAVLFIAAIPVAWVYLVSQRRAAVAALIVGLGVLFIVLYWRQRGTFFRVVPVVLIVGAAYTATFWNSTSTVGFPAQAVKTIVAQDEASAADQSSDLYRQAENFNVHSTIRASPLLGLGFGHEFHRPIPLAEITSFDLARYVPHNSLLWIWIKTGVVGFAAMFCVIGKALFLGAARARAEPDGRDALVAITAMAFIAMYTVFTYVDISWDARNGVALGYAFAVCSARFAPPRQQSIRDDGVEDGQESPNSATMGASRPA